MIKSSVDMYDIPSEPEINLKTHKMEWRVIAWKHGKRYLGTGSTLLKAKKSARTNTIALP